MTQVQDRQRRRVVTFVLATFLLACSFVAILILGWGVPSAPELVLFWAFYVFAHHLPVEAKIRGIPLAGFEPRAPLVSVGFLVLMAAAFAMSPAAAALIGLSTSLIPSMWRRGVLRGMFNSAQVSLYAGSASVIFNLIQANVTGTVLPLLIAATVGTMAGILVNHSLVATVIGMERGRSPFSVFGELAWSVPNSLAFGLAALLVAVLYRDSGAPAVPFILAPLFVLRYARKGKIELDVARERTLWAFVRAVEVKDEYTSRHSERVAQVTIALHRKLGAREEVIESRKYGALLHDIGKIGVPARILQKAGPLTSEEWEVIRRHPTVSALVVQGVDVLRDLWPEVLYHHERIDGTGYPEGLAGDQIPFAARVLAVADTFDALTSDRPYRRALSHSEALAEIKKNVGSQLDQVVVEALTELLESGREFPALPRRALSDSAGFTLGLVRGA